jgi:cell division protein FtsX
VSGFRSKKTSPADAASENGLPSDTDVLRSRIQSLEESVGNLQEQMQASSGLIKALADQNTQLVQRIERNRTLTQRMGIALALLVAVLAGAAAFLVQR